VYLKRKKLILYYSGCFYYVQRIWVLRIEKKVIILSVFFDIKLVNKLSKCHISRKNDL